MKNNLQNCKLMGVLNITDDSFSDGGDFLDFSVAKAHAVRLVKEGADIVDIGGEASGPGSVGVSVEVELSRVLPLVKFLNEYRKENGLQFLISVDTYKSQVAEMCLENGADIINDVTGLRHDVEMVNVLQKFPDSKIVVMYSKDKTARTSLNKVDFVDVVMDVANFLKDKLQLLESFGIDKSRVILDPGMGHFVSSKPYYSYELILRLNELKDEFSGVKFLLGVSRKSLLGGELKLRDERGLSLQIVAAMNGADFLRVHNVGMMKEMMKYVLNGKQ